MKRAHPSLPVVSIALSLGGGSAVAMRAEEPPWSLEMTVRAEDGAEEDRFGEVLALSDGTLAVGVPEAGVGRSGAVYLFERRQVSGTWAQIAKIVPSGLGNYDSFGQAIALDGDLLAVGVNSNDDQGGAEGTVCFFARDAGGPGVWGQVGKLTTPDPGAADQFATAIAMRDSTLVVGAFRADPFGIRDAGAAYVYERRPGLPGEWELVAELWPSNPVEIGFFGTAVAVDGPRLIVGAPREDAGGHEHAGSAYVHERGIDGWHQVARLESVNPYLGFTFGEAVAIEGETILVMDPDQAYYRRLGVHVFERTAGEPRQWLQVAQLEGGNLGRSSFALSRGEIVTSGNGSEVLLYARNTSGAWQRRGRLLAPDRLSEAFFGSAVAFDRGSLAAGAPSADTPVEDAGEVVMYRRFALELASTGTCPGPLSFEISGATPGARVALAKGERRGRGVLADCGCPRTVLYLDEPRVVRMGVADADGRLLLPIEAGLDECAIYQALDLSACRPSSTVGTEASTHVLLAKLAPPDGEYFGYAVAVDGERLAVGESWDSEVAPLAGAAYVFERDDAGRWRRVQKLVAPDAGADWTLGLEVAIDGDIVAATAIGADPIGYDETGAVYVFERDESGEWEPAKKLKKPDGTGRIWGNSVAVEGERIAVGGVIDDQCCGAVYLFERDAGGAGNWGWVAKLKGSDGDGDFGRAVALEGDRLLVGAPYEPGAAYLFERDGDGRWNEVARLVALNQEFSDKFGGSVGLSGDTVVIGDDWDDEAGYLAGAAHVFERGPSGAWLEVRKLIASDAGVGDNFGLEVAISGDTVLVGADPTLVPGPTGAVYVFSRNAGGRDRWGEVDRLVPPDGRQYDNFGTALGASGSLLLVGARYHAGGAAYLYVRKPLRWAGEAEEPKH